MNALKIAGIIVIALLVWTARVEARPLHPGYANEVAALHKQVATLKAQVKSLQHRNDRQYDMILVLQQEQGELQYRLANGWWSELSVVSHAQLDAWDEQGIGHGTIYVAP